MLSAKLLRLLQLRCSPSVTSFFHSQNAVFKNTGCNCAAASNYHVHACKRTAHDEPEATQKCRLTLRSRSGARPSSGVYSRPLHRTPGCRMQQWRWRAAYRAAPAVGASAIELPGVMFLGESRRKSRKCSLVAQQGATFSQYAPRLRQNEASMRNQYCLASSDPGSSRPFRRGGERAPPRRRVALGPMPYGNK